MEEALGAALLNIQSTRPELVANFVAALDAERGAWWHGLHGGAEVSDVLDEESEEDVAEDGEQLVQVNALQIDAIQRRRAARARREARRLAAPEATEGRRRQPVPEWIKRDGGRRKVRRTRAKNAWVAVPQVGGDAGASGRRCLMPAGSLLTFTAHALYRVSGCVSCSALLEPFGPNTSQKPAKSIRARSKTRGKGD